MLLENLIAGTGSIAAESQTAEDRRCVGPPDMAFWTDDAPPRVRRADVAGDPQTAWRKWQRHLMKRRAPAPLESLARGKTSPLAWGIVGLSLNEGCEQLLRWLRPREIARGGTRRRAKQLAAAGHAWLRDTADGERVNAALQFNGHVNGNGNGAPHSNGEPHTTTLDNADALEALAWTQLLIRRADLFDRELWWPIFERVCRLAALQEETPERNPLANLLWRIELPLALAHGFPEIEQTAALRSPAVAALPEAMTAILDSQGLPPSQHRPAFTAILASLIRCRFTAGQLAESHRSSEVDAKLQLAIQAAFRLLRRKGSLFLTSLAPDAGQPAPLAWLAKSVDKLGLDKPTRRLVGGKVRERGGGAHKAVGDQRLPSPAMHSEAGKLAVMRPDWSRRAARFAIDYADKPVHIELESAGKTLFDGAWDFELHADGRSIAAAGTWRDLCWVSDDDCDYLELEMPLAAGMKIQRQILFARRDEFVFLADAVIGEAPQALSYTGRLPLARSVTVSAAAETRELLLESGDRRAVILPLALSEWRSDRHGGALTIADGRLELQQQGRAARLYAPLWIDLSRRPADEPLTWRQLTVAEQRQNQPRDVAAGYRVQFGRRQWLIYRTLAPPANRTVLGMNLSTDFFLGRFGRDGETNTIVEVE